MNKPRLLAAVSDWTLRRFLHPPLESERWLWIATLTVILAIGIVDYATGTDFSLGIFYLIPVVFMSAWLGARSGTLVAMACTITRATADTLAADPETPLSSLYWNMLAGFLVSLLVTWLMDAIMDLRRDLEQKIKERTAELEQAVAERTRLERELLETSARERSAFGQELHDEIGQHLVATALAVQALAQRLTGPLASEAQAIVDWTEQAVAKTRNLARGLLLAEIPPTRLVNELEGLAVVTRHARIGFSVEHDDTPITAAPLACAQLFRIAQEAVSNAVRHARPKQIKISVAERNKTFYLSIEDDGIGIQHDRRRGGMGLQIMTQRAHLIGGTVTVEERAPSGTRVTCALPNSPNTPHG